MFLNAPEGCFLMVSSWLLEGAREGEVTCFRRLQKGSLKVYLHPKEPTFLGLLMMISLKKVLLKNGGYYLGLREGFGLKGSPERLFMRGLAWAPCGLASLGISENRGP